MAHDNPAASDAFTARSWRYPLFDAHHLFPLITVILLGIISFATAQLITTQLTDARLLASTISREQADTYEAQVLRSLQKIDHTLKFVKYAYENGAGSETLSRLKERELLPSGLVFSVSIINHDGDTISGTHPPLTRNVENQAFFREQRINDALMVSRPMSDAAGDPILRFSHRLATADGEFAGIVMIEVDAAHFVSGYDPAKLGDDGMLGIVGTDGIFYVQRSGERVDWGKEIDYSGLLERTAVENGKIGAVSNGWDGVERYTRVREIFGLPLAVVVGISEAEQLAPVRARMQRLVWYTVIGSLLLTGFMVVLGYMSRQLSRSRQQIMEEKARYTREIEHLAYHDVLTNLPNRTLFSELLSHGISHAHRNHKELAVLFLDLDSFKQINDAFGHDIGDALLREYSERLLACLRESDTVARMGGDEFVMLLNDIDDEYSVDGVANKIIASVSSPYSMIGQKFRITTSIGISLYPRDGEDEQTLIKNADIAMYHAKEKGKNNYQYYSEQLNAYSLERLALESGLRHAMELDQFELHYQAKQDLQSDRIAGVEVLLRWKHPELGMISPPRFISLAEDTGLILPIGRWIIETASRQFMVWRQQATLPIHLSVNLSLRQLFDETLPEFLGRNFRETGMDPRDLEVEITEQVLLYDPEKALQSVQRLKELGIRIAVDNFGTAYSSLSALKRFPIDTIKIDSSFIHDIVDNSADRAMIDAVLALSRNLNIRVVAEGVETREQVNVLREHACDEFQGFYLYKPLPAAEFTNLLQRHRDDAEAPSGIVNFPR